MSMDYKKKNDNTDYCEDDNQENEKPYFENERALEYEKNKRNKRIENNKKNKRDKKYYNDYE